jgi:alcohol dehydrogenase class IV
VSGRSAFTWRDGERTVVFGAGSSARSADLLEGWGGGWSLLTGSHGDGPPEDLVAAARSVHRVGPGQVPDLAAGLLAGDPGGDLVAWGGGRVIDTAKAVAASRGGRVCAIPTTLSGAEMTSGHRLPAGHEGAAHVRPALVLSDPDLVAGLPGGRRRASALNALAHGAEAVCTVRANPVASMAALRGASEIADGLDEGDDVALVLGALLCGYALDSSGMGLHHVLSQSIVRMLGTPHAETNAAVLPHSLVALRRRAPEAVDALAAALGSEPARLSERVSQLGGGVRLRDLGADAGGLRRAVTTAAQRESDLANIPPVPDRAELEAVALAAL